MEIHPTNGIKPISDFRKDSSNILKALQKTKGPIVLTQRGRSVAVLLDMDTFEQMEYAAHVRASYFRGVEDLAQGRSQSQEDVERMIRKK